MMQYTEFIDRLCLILFFQPVASGDWILVVLDFIHS